MTASRRNLAVAAAALIPLGFAVKFHTPEPLRHWAQLHGAALLYEVFWVLVAGFCLTRVAAVRLGLLVCAVTCALEILQLWHPPRLEAVRAHPLGAALLGTTFDARDFPYYVAGSALGVVLLVLLRGASPRPPPADLSST